MSRYLHRSGPSVALCEDVPCQDREGLWHVRQVIHFAAGRFRTIRAARRWIGEVRATLADLDREHPVRELPPPAGTASRVTGGDAGLRPARPLRSGEGRSVLRTRSPERGGK
jgi:hypothetical protein